MSRASASSDLNTPTGGSLDWVVIWIMNPSGLAASAPRISAKMCAAFGFLANTWVSSTRIPVDLEPVITSVSAALICSVAPDRLCVIRFRCSCMWKSLASSASALMIPDAWR